MWVCLHPQLYSFHYLVASKVLHIGQGKVVPIVQYVCKILDTT